MNRKQIVKLAKAILVKLQKRNGLKVSANDNIAIEYNKSVYHFTTYQLYFAIAIVLKNFHPIPSDYLKYYIKIAFAKNPLNPTEKQVSIINEILRGFSVSKIFMAGGSLTETFLAKKKGADVVIKKAIGFSFQKLSNELNFLIKFSEDPKLAVHIPKILGFKRKNKFISVFLEYHPAETLAYKILFGKIRKEKAWEEIERILRFVMSRIWSKERSTDTENYIDSFFLQRIRQNIHFLVEKAPILSKLVEADKVIINGSIYTNLLKIVDIVEGDKELIKILTPPFICSIWGDLHPNNILLSKNNFILIDPRGDMGDPIYDLGKMYHTLGPGRYDFIDNDLYCVELESKRKTPIIKRRFLISHPAWTTYEYLLKRFEKNISKFISQENRFWKLRWDFINFCIYSTMPPFLAGHEPKEERAIMGYSNALIFGRKFLDSLKKYGL